MGSGGCRGGLGVRDAGAGFCFLFLVGTSLNPVVSTPVAVMAAQVCLVAWAVVVWLGVGWAGGAVGLRTGVGWTSVQGGRGMGWVEVRGMSDGGQEGEVLVF